MQTQSTPDKARWERTKHNMEAHFERHPNDHANKGYLAKVEAKIAAGRYRHTASAAR